MFFMNVYEISCVLFSPLVSVFAAEDCASLISFPNKTICVILPPFNIAYVPPFFTMAENIFAKNDPKNTFR